jgi:hypothetical protein
MARAFAQKLLLVSHPGQVAPLLQAHPKAAQAFLTVLRQVREELEVAGFDLAAVPDTPLMIYAVAADAVLAAIPDYQRGAPFLAVLVRENLVSLFQGRFYPK